MDTTVKKFPTNSLTVFKVFDSGKKRLTRIKNRARKHLGDKDFEVLDAIISVVKDEWKVSIGILGKTIGVSQKRMYALIDRLCELGYCIKEKNGEFYINNGRRSYDSHRYTLGYWDLYQEGAEKPKKAKKEEVIEYGDLDEESFVAEMDYIEHYVDGSLGLWR